MNPLRQPRIVILGAGMTGILLTIKLQQAGIRDIRVLEKGCELGGTWRDNRYPGVACDVPAHMYCYSFEPNPEWSHRFARGDEIQAYFLKIAEKYGVRERVRFNETVTKAEYRSGTWHLTTNRGRQLECDFFISATGILHKPRIPVIPGMDDYQGKLQHTTGWDPDQKLAGQRIAVVGTGSTATQMVSALAQSDAEVTVYQRTPQWIFPMPDRHYSERLRARCRRHPVWMAATRWLYENVLMNLFQRAVTGQALPHALVSLACKAYLRWQIRDPVLRATLTPDYTVGCKRLVINAKYYQALKRDNVELVTEGIAGFTPTGIQTRDGRERHFDQVVLATGFDPRAYLRPIEMKGLDGASLDDAWQSKIQAYRSVLLPGFPNFFLMLGPNTPIGNWSVIAMSEVQTGYVLKLIEGWRRGEYDELNVTHQAMADYNHYLKVGMAGTVWTSGCQSWYLDQDGAPISWPYPWKQWVAEMAQPRWADFELRRFDDQQGTKHPCPVADSSDDYRKCD